MEELLLSDIRWDVQGRDRLLRCSMSWVVRGKRLALRVCVWVLGWVWLLFGLRNENDSVHECTILGPYRHMATGRTGWVIVSIVVLSSRFTFWYIDLILEVNLL